MDGLTPVASGKIGTPNVAQVKEKGDVFLFEGFIQIPTEGSYTFFLKSSNSTFVRIHEASVIDADYGYETGSEKKGTMNLKPGYHPIRIYYKKKPGATPKLDLRWSGPTIEKSTIPESAFFVVN